MLKCGKGSTLLNTIALSYTQLPEGLPKEQELAIIYSLQNCHSIQEIIKCLVSFRASSPSDKLTGFQVGGGACRAEQWRIRSKFRSCNSQWKILSETKF